MPVKELMSLFAGSERGHGVYVLEQASNAQKKRAGRAQTVVGAATEKDWQAHLAGKVGLGVIPIKDDNTCAWGAIDIDVYPSDLEQVEAMCKAFNFPLVPCRTKSGGIHLFLFLDPPVPADLVRSRLLSFAATLGHPGVEVFPKQVRLPSSKDVGNWLNMPYFGGDETDRYAMIGAKKATLAEFIARAKKLRLNQQQLHEVGIDPSVFGDGPPCLNTLAGQGFPQGTRNEGLFAIGVYTRMKFPEEWETKMIEFNDQLMRPPLGTQEIKQISKSLSRKKYFYPCERPPLVNCCNKQLCRTRQFGIGTGATEDIGVTVGSLAKIDTNPPTWIMTVDGVHLELDSTDLVDQKRFRLCCLEKLNKLPNLVKGLTWEKLLQSWLENVDVQQAPPDAGPEGELLYLLEQFCTNVSPAKTRDEILMGKPFVEDSRVLFRSSDLRRYLDQQHFRTITGKKVWAVLRRGAHAEYKAVSIKGKTTWVWSIPQYTHQTGDFDVPKMQ